MNQATLNAFRAMAEKHGYRVTVTIVDGKDVFNVYRHGVKVGETLTRAGAEELIYSHNLKGRTFPEVGR